MQVRSRGKGILDENQPLFDHADSKMADNVLSGNKVSDVTMNEKKMASNNNSEKSPSVHSDDSFSKLTMKKDEESGCCPRENKLIIVIKLVACILCGIVFGIMFVKSRG